MVWGADGVFANAWSDLHHSMLPVIRGDRSLSWLQITLGLCFPLLIREQSACCGQPLHRLIRLLLLCSGPEGSCPAGVCPMR